MLAAEENVLATEEKKVCACGPRPLWYLDAAANVEKCAVCEMRGAEELEIESERVDLDDRGSVVELWERWLGDTLFSDLEE